ARLRGHSHADHSRVLALLAPPAPVVSGLSEPVVLLHDRSAVSFRRAAARAVLHRMLLEKTSTGDPGASAGWKTERQSVYLTNCLIGAAVLALGWAIGFSTLLLVHLPVALLASSAEVWLFHVQHCFDATYWARHAQWDYVRAGLYGSSYYKLPRPLQWLTANIGLHHVHHLDTRIPNYRLHACLDSIPQLDAVRPLTVKRSLACATLTLWDERAERHVRF